MANEVPPEQHSSEIKASLSHRAPLVGPRPAEADDYVVAELVGGPGPRPDETGRVLPRWRWPLALYVATWCTTVFVGSLQFGLWGGVLYSAALMTILSCHEMGHYLQTRRYGVAASLPYFLPLPLPPFGTIGAIIRMDARIPDRRALYDIGISGPLAGLVPALVFCLVGLHWSEVLPRHLIEVSFGKPLLFQWFGYWEFGTLPRDLDIAMHPVALAGWVGLFITSLNLLPIGQLDGGHVLYALLRRRANGVARFILLALAVTVVSLMWFHWLLMLALLVLMGASHPPTRNDNAVLGFGRQILGWATLAFLFLGFTPLPLGPIERHKPEPRDEFVLDMPRLPIRENAGSSGRDAADQIFSPELRFASQQSEATIVKLGLPPDKLSHVFQ